MYVMLYGMMCCDANSFIHIGYKPSFKEGDIGGCCTPHYRKKFGKYRNTAKKESENTTIS